MCYRPGEMALPGSPFFFFSLSLLNFLVGQAGADKGEPVVSRHIADFWQNSPGSRKFTHFLAPGQAVLVGLGMAFPSVKKMAFFPPLFFLYPASLFLQRARRWKAPVCWVRTVEKVKFRHGEQFSDLKMFMYLSSSLNPVGTTCLVPTLLWPE